MTCQVSQKATRNDAQERDVEHVGYRSTPRETGKMDASVGMYIP
jgi:hypothetical protein